MVRIIIISVFLTCFYTIIPAQTNMSIDKINFEKIVIGNFIGNKRFSPMKSNLFSGISQIREIKSNMNLIIFVGRYEKRINNKQTFILLLNCIDSTSIQKVGLFEFYTDHIDNVFYDKEKIFIIFKDQTEQYGWIKWHIDKFIFKMFHDPEL